jgi:hypothetical protein
MSYHDGGFYFMQPVGAGYGAVSLRNGRGYGASRPAYLDETLGERQLKKIVSWQKNYIDNAWSRIGAYTLGTAARETAAKEWANATFEAIALGDMAASAKNLTWRVKNLPKNLAKRFQSWIKGQFIDPRYKAGGVSQGPVVATSAPRARDRVGAVGGGAGTLLSAGSGLRVTQSGTGTATGIPVATVTVTPYTPPGTIDTSTVTTMGPQAVPTEQQAAATLLQASVAQEASAVVDQAVAESQTPGGVMGFLSTTTGKVAAGAVLLGAFYLWNQSRKARV